MNIFEQKINKYRKLLTYKGGAILICILFIVFELCFLYARIVNNKKQYTLLEHKITASETRHNKLIFENSLISKADAMYHSAALQKSLAINSYVVDLNNIIQSTANYYGIFHPIKVTLSYNNAPTGVTALVPVKLSINMLNVFDYTPIRLIFILFSNTSGSMSCHGLSISREYTGNLFEQMSKKSYLFSSSINLEWLVLLKPSEASYKKTFFINYKPVKDLEKIEYMYNMATWNESFMLFPNEIERLKDIQSSMR